MVTAVLKEPALLAMKLDKKDIQGIVLHGYGRLPYAWYGVLRFDPNGDAQSWLRRVLLEISSADPDDAPSAERVNVAFSARGLLGIGLEPEALVSFPREFVQGMAHPERSLVLGDEGEDAPEGWEYGGPARPVDGLLLLYATSEKRLRRLASRHSAWLEAAGIAFVAEFAWLPADHREHFGFVDDVSQPVIERGVLRRGPSVRAGEFVLGYRDERGGRAEALRVSELSHRVTRRLPPAVGDGLLDFGRNGSYLAYRKLEQDVARFWREAYARVELEERLDFDAAARRVAASWIGRWPNGAPLALYPHTEPDSPRKGSNDFGYRASDPHGLACPIGAHVRRANPRDALGEDAASSLRSVRRHRILRRGRLYGPKLDGPFPRNDDRVPRGILFMALGASLSRGFEFIQQNWLNNSKFGGLSGERDPLLGNAKDPLDPDRPRIFTRPTPLARQRQVGLARFVRLRAGAYLFVPSRRALNYLAESRGRLA